MFRRQHPGQCVLGVVGILILIDQDVTKPLLILFQHCRIFFEQTDRHVHQVVEVHGVVGQELFLIQLVNRSHPLLIVIVGLRGKSRRGDQLVFRIGNRTDHAAHGKLPLRQIQFLQALPYQQLDVPFVINRKMPAIPSGRFNLHPQEPGAKCMECTQPDLFGSRTDDIFHPLFHFRSRFVCEGDGQDFPWFYVLFQKIGDTARQHARFS